MSRIVISGASGDLGRRVTKLLLKNTAHEDLTLVTRTPGKLSDRAAQGIRVLQGEYQDRESLDAAYLGAETLFLISGLNLGRRIAEHRNAIVGEQQSPPLRLQLYQVADARASCFIVFSIVQYVT